MTYQLIETKTLASAAASIEFTSIPQDGTDLLIKVSGRTDRGGGNNNDQCFINFNGLTTNQSGRELVGDGSTAASYTASRLLFYTTATTATSNTFGNSLIYIPNYSGSTNKSLMTDSVTENNATGAVQNLFAGLWSSTATITSVTLATNNNFVSGTTASLYKITKGSSGGVVVS